MSEQRLSSMIKQGALAVCSVLISMLAVAIHAQELLPELAPIAAKHKADSDTLLQQQKAAIARAQQPYLSALDAEERTATAAGKLPVVAAITNERTAVTENTLPATPPAELPKNLQLSRKTYLADNDRITAGFSQQQQRIDADYLRSLAALQFRAARNPALATQIAEEKKRLLEGSSSENNVENGRAAHKGKNAVVNSNFSEIGTDGKPTGWRLVSPAAGVRTEGANSFLHCEVPAGRPAFIICTQTLAIPKNAKTITGRVKARVDRYQKGANQNNPNRDTRPAGALVTFLREAKPGIGWKCLVTLDRNTSGWKAFQAERYPIPALADGVKVELGLYDAAGVFDFDDVEIEFQ